jgi:hypothetical protein
MKRRWFQLHLSTWVTLILIVSALYGVYLTVFADIVEMRIRLQQQYNPTASWWVAYWSVVPSIRRDPIEFFILVLGPVAMIVSVVYLLELSIRRRARGQLPEEPQ